MIEHSGIRDYWHPVALASELADKPIGRKLLDTPIVLWRSADGRCSWRCTATWPRASWEAP